MKQKIYGIVLLMIGIIEMVLLPEDATGGFMICLLSLCLMFGKNDLPRNI